MVSSPLRRLAPLLVLLLSLVSPAVGSQDPAPELDHAFELYVGKARHYDPEATMAWAESITDPSRRVRAMKQVASIWKNRDRDAFDAYLHESGLSEGDVKNLQ